VVIRYDSEYAAKSVQGIFNGKKNTELIAEARRHYAALSRVMVAGHSVEAMRPTRAVEVAFVHVKGHSNSRWNDRADELAGFGAAGRVCETGRYRSGYFSSSVEHGAESVPSTATSSSIGKILAGSAVSQSSLLTKRSILGNEAKRNLHSLPDSRFSASHMLDTYNRRRNLTSAATSSVMTSKTVQAAIRSSNDVLAWTDTTTTVYSQTTLFNIPHSASDEMILSGGESCNLEVISLSSGSGSECEEGENEAEDSLESVQKKRKIEVIEILESP
jgi:hypothetical protein